MNLLRRFLAAWRNWINPVPLLPDVKPPLVYTDPHGQGWTRAPDYQDAEAPDDGQNDVWKRELRFSMWRYVNGLVEPGTFSLRDAGLSKYADLRSKGPLFPLGGDLACACRRLGFARLARATGVFQHGDLFDSDTVIAAFYSENEAAVIIEAEAQHARASATAANWNEAARGPFAFDTIEQTIALYTLGPINGHADAPPMRPYSLTIAPPVADVTGTATGTGPRVTGR